MESPKVELDLEETSIYTVKYVPWECTMRKQTVAITTPRLCIALFFTIKQDSKGKAGWEKS